MPTRREVLTLGCGLMASFMLKDFVRAQAAEVQPTDLPQDAMTYVNTEFRETLRQILNAPNFNIPLNDSTLKQTREFMNQLAQPILPAPAVKERMIPGPVGSPPVRIYMVGDSPGASKPAILHLHGGGYVAGSAALSRSEIQDLSIAHDCVAITVEYRLAPETKFPGSLEDNYMALQWMYTNSKELGIDTTRIAIKGESAGGGHAAALAIAARDRAEVPICLQILIYPMLDDRTGSSRSVPNFLGRFIWTPDQNRYGWKSLLGVTPGAIDVPPNSVPARVSNLKGLPPAFIGVGSIDLFAPEDLEYAQRLIDAGVEVELNLVPGGFHAFDKLAPDVSLSQQFTKAWNEALRRKFQKP